MLDVYKRKLWYDDMGRTLCLPTHSSQEKPLCVSVADLLKTKTKVLFVLLQ